MNNQHTTRALVPIKAFDKAKTRLRGALTADQCANLTRCMATDVVLALHDASAVHAVTLLGEPPVVEDFARDLDCDFYADQFGTGLSANLDAAAIGLQQADVRTLLVLPGDLPMLRASDIDELLGRHAGGLTVCPASRDGGTNALVVSPPAAIKFCYGQQSARRHLEAGHAANLDAELVPCDAFGHDIDTPDDLIRFCGESVSGCTFDFLNKTGICEKLREHNRATMHE